MGRTFEVDVVLVRYTENVISLVSLDRLEQVALGILEVDLDSGQERRGRMSQRAKRESGNAYPSPGFGRVMPP